MNHPHRARGLFSRTLLVALVAALPALGVSTSFASHAERSEHQIEQDKSASARVRSALEADTVKFPHVHVMTYWGTTQLAGFVDSADHKDRAAEVAKRVLGNTGKLENSLSVMDDTRKDKTTQLPERSEGEVVDDKKINTAVTNALSNDSLKYPQVGVSTYRGVVQLAGFVTHADQKKQAGEVAKRVPGVKNVENNITVVEGK